MAYEDVGTDVLVLASGPSDLPQLLTDTLSGHGFPPSPPFPSDV